MNAFSIPPRPSTRPILSIVPAGRPSTISGLASIAKMVDDTLSAERPEAKAKAKATPASRFVNVANRVAVAIYKLIGFAILTVIVGGLLSYLGVNAFYFANSSWVVPTALTPNDERVLRVDSMIAQEAARRDALLTQRLELDAQLANASRVDATETAFQTSFKVALDTDLAKRADALQRFQGLLAHYEHAKSEILDARKAYAGMSKGQISNAFDAHLIDKDAMINGNFQLAQLAGADLALRERSVEVADRVASLGHDVRSLRAATNRHELDSAALSYEMLRMEHEYDISVMTSQKARDDVKRLQKSIVILDRSVADYERLTQKLASSPYALAGDKKSTVVFVPYDNLGNVSAGAPVYGCRFGLLGCQDVGSLGAAIDGEVVEKHPVHGRDVRGVMMHVVLRDNGAGQKPVLHVGRKPLFI